MNEYFVTKRPGFYGDATVVKSSHKTKEGAIRKIGKDGSLCIRKGGLVKGEKFLSCFEAVYPLIPLRKQ